MRAVVLFLSLIVLNSCYCANILGFFFFPSISHQVTFQAIWKELSLRGHNLTVITPNPINDSKLTNLTEINLNYTYEIMQKYYLGDIASKDKHPLQIMKGLFELSEVLADAELGDKNVQNVLSLDKDSFDLILVEAHIPFTYALTAKFNAPLIAISSFGVHIHTHDYIGNPTYPVLTPDLVLPYTGNLNFWQRLNSFWYSVLYRLYYYYFKIADFDVIVKQHFGKDTPNVGDLHKNISMLFLHVNPVLYSVRPNLPNVVEISGLHLKKPKQLPKNLQKLLDNAKQGAVYFSLGSNVKSVNLTKSLRNNIIEALAELPYTVLWKWETDHLPGQPKNVHIRKWLPQMDVLAHQNVKAFVTQGGLQSVEEAIYTAVPLVGMPFLGDQPRNVQKLQDFGVAISVDPNTLTKDQLKSAIIEVVENKKYKLKMLEARSIVQDQPVSGLEKAVWWSEYVIRHKGAKHLRSPALDLPLYQYFLLDVVAISLVGLFFILYILYKAILGVMSSNKIVKHKLS